MWLSWCDRKDYSRRGGDVQKRATGRMFEPGPAGWGLQPRCMRRSLARSTTEAVTPEMVFSWYHPYSPSRTLNAEGAIVWKVLHQSPSWRYDLHFMKTGDFYLNIYLILPLRCISEWSIALYTSLHSFDRFNYFLLLRWISYTNDNITEFKVQPHVGVFFPRLPPGALHLSTNLHSGCEARAFLVWTSGCSGFLPQSKDTHAVFSFSTP